MFVCWQNSPQGDVSQRFSIFPGNRHLLLRGESSDHLHANSHSLGGATPTIVAAFCQEMHIQLHSQAYSHLIIHEWLTFYSAFFNSHWNGALKHWHGWCHVKLLPSQHVLCTPRSHKPCHFTQSHVSKVHACLAVTCHLHFWQNDRDLLRATAVTRGWNGYQNKSQHRKLQGLEPVTFQSWVWYSNHWAIPAPGCR